MTQLHAVLNKKGKEIARLLPDAAARMADDIGGTTEATDAEYLECIRRAFPDAVNVTPTPTPAAPPTPAPAEKFETVDNGWGGTTTRRRQPARQGGGPRPAKKASDASLRYLRTLLTERAGQAIAERVRQEMNDARTQGDLTQARVSAAIDTLKALPRAGADQPRQQGGGQRGSGGPRITEDGFYADPDTGSVFKVQVAHHGSGNLYAKRLVLPTDSERAELLAQGRKPKGTWEYEAGLVRKLRPEWKLDKDSAAKWGQLYGYCCRCAAILEDETSIANGIGPICAGKW